MPALDALDPKMAVEDPRYIGAIELIRRVGAREIQLRYDEEQHPIVWVCTAAETRCSTKISRRNRWKTFTAGISGIQK
jgi:hypothetical protein